MGRFRLVALSEKEWLAWYQRMLDKIEAMRQVPAKRRRRARENRKRAALRGKK